MEPELRAKPRGNVMVLHKDTCRISSEGFLAEHEEEHPPNPHPPALACCCLLAVACLLAHSAYKDVAMPFG